MTKKAQSSKLKAQNYLPCRQAGNLKLKIFLFAFCFVILHFTFYILHFTYAAGEFAVAYDTTYEIQEDGFAKVVANVALTNKLSNVYATEYNLVLEKGEISEIRAWDSQGEIKTETKTEENQTKVNLKFNDQVAGIGKTLRFTLQYKIAGLAKKSGEVWQIILPQQKDTAYLTDLTTILKIPKSFPSLAFITPQPSSQNQTEKFKQYSFSKESLEEGGVVAAFGDFQIFNFSLVYHLSNPEGKTVFTKIALPPATPYQSVSYYQIDPEPKDVEVDDDGNWLAVYFLSPKQKRDIFVRGQVKIYARPAVEPDFPIKNPDQYLVPQVFWEVNNLQIQELASRLQTPQAIYNYVIEILSYDYQKVKTKQERMGAVAALKQPEKAICMEFTDLFITLARAAGIPARELNGFAYTDNPKLKPLSEQADILHSWPEYWDKNQRKWIPVDPTWEKTSGIDYFNKLDLSHFVFAIHGKDSQFPVPAGAYKEKNQRQKDIQIDFGTLEEEKESQLQAHFLLPKSYFGERGVSGKIILENRGPAPFYNLPLEVKAEGVTLKNQKETRVAVFPPFAKKEILIWTGRLWWPRMKEVKISLLAKNLTFSYNIVANSLILNFILPVVGGIVVGGSLIVFILKIRGK